MKNLILVVLLVVVVANVFSADVVNAQGGGCIATLERSINGEITITTDVAFRGIWIMYKDPSAVHMEGTAVRSSEKMSTLAELIGRQIILSDGVSYTPEVMRWHAVDFSNLVSFPSFDQTTVYLLARIDVNTITISMGHLPSFEGFTGVSIYQGPGLFMDGTTCSITW